MNLPVLDSQLPIDGMLPCRNHVLYIDLQKSEHWGYTGCLTGIVPADSATTGPVPRQQGVVLRYNCRADNTHSGHGASRMLGVLAI